MCFKKIKEKICSCSFLSRFLCCKKSDSCCNSDGEKKDNDLCCKSNESDKCCKKGKCCPGKFLVKLLFIFGLFYIFNTYFGFSNKAIENYVNKNPKVILESIERMIKDERGAKTQVSEEKVKEISSKISSDDMPFVGNKSGDKIVVEFFDYNCGYCKKANQEIADAVLKDKEIKVILVNTPILSEGSMWAAKASLGVFKLFPEKFANFHHKLIGSKQQITKDEIKKILKSSGVDLAKITSFMESKDSDEEIKKSYELMKELGIQGTPAFIIKGKLNPGFMQSSEIVSSFK